MKTILCQVRFKDRSPGLTYIFLPPLWLRLLLALLSFPIWLLFPSTFDRRTQSLFPSSEVLISYLKLMLWLLLYYYRLGFCLDEGRLFIVCLLCASFLHARFSGRRHRNNQFTGIGFLGQQFLHWFLPTLLGGAWTLWTLILLSKSTLPTLWMNVGQLCCGILRTELPSWIEELLPAERRLEGLGHLQHSYLLLQPTFR